MASFLATLALDAPRCHICPAAIPSAVAAFFAVCNRVSHGGACLLVEGRRVSDPVMDFVGVVGLLTSVGYAVRLGEKSFPGHPLLGAWRQRRQSVNLTHAVESSGLG